MTFPRLARGSLAVALFAIFPMICSGVSFTLSTNRTDFEGQIGTSITDDYSDPGYTTGDVFDGHPYFDGFTDAGMSSVLGETTYTIVGLGAIHFVLAQPASPYYCPSCSDFVTLGFTTTSIGTPDGVFGVAFDYAAHELYLDPPDPPSVRDYAIFITFGDGTIIEFDLAGTGQNELPDVIAGNGFFGITSPDRIREAFIGVASGTDDQGGTFGLDNLTIAAAPSAIPEPTTWLLFGSGVLGLAARRRKP